MVGQRCRCRCCNKAYKQRPRIFVIFKALLGCPCIFFCLLSLPCADADEVDALRFNLGPDLQTLLALSHSMLTLARSINNMMCI
jgi:hypothetical protein